MNFLKKIFESKEPGNNYEPKITVGKIQHIFEYGRKNTLFGTGDDSLKDFKVGHLITWVAEPYYYKGYKNIPAQTVPPNIKWSNDPVFAYVSIVDGNVKYHWSDEGGSAVFLCPVTTNSEHIRHIDKIFEHYYSEVFKLPQSLNEVKIVKGKVDKTDKMKFLKEYLTTQNNDFFKDNFYDDSDGHNIVMWIDWREEDENIVTYCERILQTNQLSAETLDAENKRGFDIIITYKNQKTIIPYKGAGADRDTTIKTLNKTIQTEFEIRLCKESLGSDTLCFLPLAKEQWSELEAKYPGQVDEKFEK